MTIVRESPFVGKGRIKWGKAPQIAPYMLSF